MSFQRVKGKQWRSEELYCFVGDDVRTGARCGERPGRSPNNSTILYRIVKRLEFYYEIDDGPSNLIVPFKTW